MVNKVYNDFVNIYNSTSRRVDNNVLNQMVNISNNYDNVDRECVEKAFTIIYAGMIAEENKVNTRLEKNKETWNSATFMRGMEWRQIVQLCTERGF